MTLLLLLFIKEQQSVFIPKRVNAMIGVYVQRTSSANRPPTKASLNDFFARQSSSNVKIRSVMAHARKWK